MKWHIAIRAIMNNRVVLGEGRWMGRGQCSLEVSGDFSEEVPFEEAND